MRSTKGHKIATLDLETDPFLANRIPEPFAAGFYDGSLYLETWGDDCVAELLDQVAELPDDYVIYVHNGGHFDFWMMWEYIDERRQAFIIHGRLTEFSMTGANHIFRDSMAIFPFALSKYQKDKIDYRKLERPVRERHKPEIRRYMRSDCVNLYDLCIRFAERFTPDNGSIPISIGQASVRELMDAHPFQTMTEATDSIIRPWYMGGRNQCFASGILPGPWKIYDMNSAYWKAMADYAHPLTDLWDHLDRPPTARGALWLAEFKGRNRQAIPVNTSESLDFTLPTGFQSQDLELQLKLGHTRVGTFLACSHELVPAMRAGLVEVDEWIQILKPLETGTLHKFIDKFSAEKIAAAQAGDRIGELIAKYIGNSAYGKTGQDPAEFKDYKILRDPFRDKALVAAGFEPEQRLSDDPFLEIWSKQSEFHNNGYYNVGIAASVTSATRALLLEGLRHAVDPIYCDTDSIICRDFHGDIDRYRLGAWKLEGTAEYAAIAGKKLYCLYNRNGRKIEVVKMASKGGTLSGQDIIDAANGRIVENINQAPTFSLSRGIGFTSRKFRRTVDNPLPFA